MRVKSASGATLSFAMESREDSRRPNITPRPRSSSIHTPPEFPAAWLPFPKISRQTKEHREPFAPRREAEAGYRKMDTLRRGMCRPIRSREMRSTAYCNLGIDDSCVPPREMMLADNCACGLGMAFCTVFGIARVSRKNRLRTLTQPELTVSPLLRKEYNRRTCTRKTAVAIEGARLVFALCVNEHTQQYDVSMLVLWQTIGNFIVVALLCDEDVHR